MEGRTREALHQVADGLIVSEHDLDRMEGNLMTLLDSRPTDEHAPPRRRKDWAVAAAAAVALVVSGVAFWEANHDSSPTQPAVRPAPRPSLVPPELVGLWQNQDSPWLWEFTVDGRILNTSTAEGYLRGSGDLRGGDGAMTVVDRRGDVYTLTDASTAATTPGTPTGPDNGCGTRIQVVAPETVTYRDECSGDAGISLRFERLSPRDPAAPALAPRFPVGVARRVTLVTQLEGTWVNRETNRVLVVASPAVGEGLTYLVDDDGDGSVRPDQRGVLTLAPDGSVRPQPRTSSPAGCAPVFSKAISNVATLVTTSGRNGCFPAGSTQTWLRIN
jgi:hypothetical protein